MSFFADLSIRTKVIGAFATVLVATVGLGFFAVDQLQAVNSRAAEVRVNWLPALYDLGRLAQFSEKYRLNQSQLLLETTPEAIAKREAEIKVILDNRTAAWGTYLPTVSTAEERSYADGISKNWDEYQVLSTKLVTAFHENHRDEAVRLLNVDGREAFDRMRGFLEKDMAFNKEHGFAEADAGEAIYKSGRLWIFGAIGAAVLLAIGAGFSLVAGVSRPILRMTNAMDRLSKHELQTEIAGVGRKDEIGRMAEAVQVFKQGLIDADRLAAEQQAEQAAKERRQALIEQYVAGFDQSVRETLGMLASASTEMNATATSMSTIAEETGRQATAVAVASEQASANVQTVASASEEMAASISEIARQVSQSADIARGAVSEAASANATMQGLADAAQKVGEVVALINDIASQTNLLALNATIEAARAGEAGKGFAVVASEVKALANQTGKATDEISGQVTAIQAAARNAVDAIKAIDGTIARINDVSSIIAAAIEEQGAATREISRNTQEAAQGTNEVSRNIGGVNDAAAQTGVAATQVLDASSELGRQSEALRAEVDRFLSDLKAA